MRREEDQSEYDEIIICRKCSEPVPVGMDYCKCGTKATRDRIKGGVPSGERDLVERMSRNVGQRLAEGFYGESE